MDCPLNQAISVWSVCKNWWVKEQADFQADLDAEDSAGFQSSLVALLACSYWGQFLLDDSVRESCPEHTKQNIHTLFIWHPFIINTLSKSET